MAAKPDERAEGPIADGPLRRTLETVNIVALGLWLGTVAMSGATAAVIFPAARELAPDLPDYAALPPAEQADLAAGFIQNRVFYLADVVQFTAAAVALLTLLALIIAARLPIRRISTAVRLCGLGLALGLLSFWMMVLAPRMQTELRNYWSAASAGDVDTARDHRQRFEQDHPLASNVMVGIAISVAAALAGAAFNAASLGGDTGARTPPTGPAPRRLALETPRLARSPVR